jgi:hypothetical protein
VLRSTFTRAVAVRARAKEKFSSALKINSELGADRRSFIANETTQRISLDLSLALRRAANALFHRAKPSLHCDVIRACGSPHHASASLPRTSHKLAAVGQCRLPPGRDVPHPYCSCGSRFETSSIGDSRMGTAKLRKTHGLRNGPNWHPPCIQQDGDACSRLLTPQLYEFAVETSGLHHRPQAPINFSKQNNAF